MQNFQYNTSTGLDECLSLKTYQEETYETGRERVWHFHFLLHAEQRRYVNLMSVVTLQPPSRPPQPRRKLRMLPKPSRLLPGMPPPSTVPSSSWRNRQTPTLPLIPNTRPMPIWKHDYQPDDAGAKASASFYGSTQESREAIWPPGSADRSSQVFEGIFMQFSSDPTFPNGRIGKTGAYRCPSRWARPARCRWSPVLSRTGQRPARSEESDP